MTVQLVLALAAGFVLAWGGKRVTGRRPPVPAPPARAGDRPAEPVPPAPVWWRKVDRRYWTAGAIAAAVVVAVGLLFAGARWVVVSMEQARAANATELAPPPTSAPETHEDRYRRLADELGDPFAVWGRCVPSNLAVRAIGVESDADGAPRLNPRVAWELMLQIISLDEVDPASLSLSATNERLRPVVTAAPVAGSTLLCQPTSSTTTTGVTR